MLVVLGISQQVPAFIVAKEYSTGKLSSSRI